MHKVGKDMGNNQIRQVLRNKQFCIFLTGQCISNIGEACRFVAITLFLVNLTGSGVSTVLGLICAAIPGLIFSPFAGVIGDMLPEKPLLAAADFLRAALVLLFPGCTSASEIYVLLVILSIIDTLCSPARRKFLVGIIGKGSVLPANTLLTGVSGIAFLIGPLVGGVLVDYMGSNPPFYINAATYIFSGITILMIKYHWLPAVRSGRSRSFINIDTLCREMLHGFRYAASHKQIMKTILICTALGFSMVSMNMAFYPFAFDDLKVTAKGWSLMLSIFYGTNLVAMAVSPALMKTIKNKPLFMVFSIMCITSCIWAVYAFAGSLELVLLLQFIEGTILAAAGIILSTLLQTLPDRDFIARVSGVNDLAGSACKLIAMFFTFYILKNYDHTIIFLFNSILMFIYSFYNLCKRHEPQRI